MRRWRRRWCWPSSTARCSAPTWPSATHRHGPQASCPGMKLAAAQALAGELIAVERDPRREQGTAGAGLLGLPVQPAHPGLRPGRWQRPAHRNRRQRTPVRRPRHAAPAHRGRPARPAATRPPMPAPQHRRPPACWPRPARPEARSRERAAGTSLRSPMCRTPTTPRNCRACWARCRCNCWAGRRPSPSACRRWAWTPSPRCWRCRAMPLHGASAPARWWTSTACWAAFPIRCRPFIHRRSSRRASSCPPTW